MVRVISCVKGTGLNAGYWVITYEDPSHWSSWEWSKSRALAGRHIHI